MVFAVALVVVAAAGAHYRPPSTSSSCEGTALVVRDHDHRELRRTMMSPTCLKTRCEGGTLVTSTLDGDELSRAALSARCVVTRCEGTTLVTSSTRGVELTRDPNSGRCAVPLADDEIRLCKPLSCAVRDCSCNPRPSPPQEPGCVWGPDPCPPCGIPCEVSERHRVPLPRQTP